MSAGPAGAFLKSRDGRQSSLLEVEVFGSGPERAHHAHSLDLVPRAHVFAEDEGTVHGLGGAEDESILEGERALGLEVPGGLEDQRSFDRHEPVEEGANVGSRCCFEALRASRE